MKLVRAWKLFLLVPRMLLHKAPGERSVGKELLQARADDFARGLWLELLDDASACAIKGASTVKPLSAEQRGVAAEASVRLSWSGVGTFL